MQIKKSIETLEVTEDNKVILRERVSLLEKGKVQEEYKVEVDGEVTYEVHDKDGLIEKTHWFEQRTIKAGEDYSQECDKVKAVCDSVFALPLDEEES